MKYKPGVEQDENLRVLKCPKCQNEHFSDNAEHCNICGTILYNYCATPSNNFDGSVAKKIFYFSNILLYTLNYTIIPIGGKDYEREYI